MSSRVPTLDDRELAEAESKLAFVRTVDEGRADGLTGPQIWRAAFVEGYLRALAPRGWVEIDLDMEAALNEEALTTPGWRKTCAPPMN